MFPQQRSTGRGRWSVEGFLEPKDQGDPVRVSFVTAVRCLPLLAFVHSSWAHSQHWLETWRTAGFGLTRQWRCQPGFSLSNERPCDATQSSCRARFSLPRHASIENDQSKQINDIEGFNISFVKRSTVTAGVLICHRT